MHYLSHSSRHLCSATTVFLLVKPIRLCTCVSHSGITSHFPPAASDQWRSRDQPLRYDRRDETAPLRLWYPYVGVSRVINRYLLTYLLTCGTDSVLIGGHQTGCMKLQRRVGQSAAQQFTPSWASQVGGGSKRHWLFDRNEISDVTSSRSTDSSLLIEDSDVFRQRTKSRRVARTIGRHTNSSNRNHFTPSVAIWVQLLSILCRKG